MTETDTAAPTRPPPMARPALRRVMLVLAAACGLSVANIYYAQPLLDPIASAFKVSQGSAALVVTVTQLGYALGLVALMPLGDLLENRALASRTLLITAAALVAAALAPGFGVFLVVSVLVGVTSVVAQILIPFAAHLAPEEERGKFVGTVMTGLLLGILLARTMASLVAAAWGWRAIYLISGVLMVVISAVLVKLLPRRHPDHPHGYGHLMKSVVGLAREEPILRRRAICQALLFGAFSCFWTSVAFELIRRHHMGQIGIGAFALVGAAGAVAAPVSGRLGDLGYGKAASGTALVLGIAAMVLAGVGAGSVVVLAVAGVLLDLAVQGHQVLSQRVIYGLRPDARARINTVYMTTVFLGGAAASGVSGAVHNMWGWTGVTALGAVLVLIALVLWAIDALRDRPASGRR